MRKKSGLRRPIHQDVPRSVENQIKTKNPAVGKGERSATEIQEAVMLCESIPFDARKRLWRWTPKEGL